MTDSAEELRREKEQLDGLFELSLDAVILTDDDFHVLRVNQEFTRIFGYTAQEAAGQGLADLIVPEELHGEHVEHRASLLSGKRIEFEGIRQRKDGLRFEVSVVAKSISLGFDKIAVYLIYRDITEYKEAKRKLERSERELRDVVNTVPAHVWSTSPEGEVDFVNDRWLQFTGLALEEALGGEWEPLIHPDDRAKVVGDWHTAISNGQAMQCEARVWRADGRYCWWFIRNVPLRDETGKLVKWYGTAIDIEDRKQAEQALRKSEERWRSVFENSAIGVSLTDPDGGRFLATNHVYQKMLGYTEEELRALSFLDVTSEEYREANWALDTELLEGKRQQFQMEKKYRRKDGSLIWASINVSLVPGTDRVPRFFMALSEDITERKRAEEALRRSEAYLAEGQRLAKMGSWAVNPNTERPIYWSDEMRQIFGLDPQRSNLPNREEFLRLVHPDDRDGFLERVDQALRAKTDIAVDYRIVLPDGTVKHIHGIGHPVLDETGNIIEYVGTDVDVTERKQAEEALRRSEAYLAEGQRLAKTGSWAYNPNTEKAVYWSEQMQRIWGLDPKKSNLPDSEEFFRMLHPDDRDRFGEVIQKARREKADFVQDYRIVLADGTVKHIHGIGRPVLDATGNIIEYVGTDVDVTERKLAEEALRRSEGYLAEAQRLSHTGSWAVQFPQRQIIYWSKELYRIFCLESGPMPPSRVEATQWMHPEDIPNLDAIVEQSIRNRTGFEVDYRLLLPNGTTKYIHAVGYPVVNASGDVIELVGTAMDVTEQHEARAALQTAFEQIKAEQTELRRMVDAIATYIFVLGPDGAPLYANQTVLDYSGFTLQDLQSGDHRARILHPEDVERLREERQEALARGVPFENEQRGLGKDGRYRWFLVRYNPLRDDHGRIIRWYATGTDIDDRKQAEERMRDENLALREQIDQAFMFEEIVGSSPPLQNVLSSILKVAPTNSTVLITGETGTGKELIARAIHKHSQRSGQAFISVNCASIPTSLIASELFGHEKGAFTGAVQRRLGRFELAHSGTIFLDEVGDLPAETQVTLLRVLQERQFERVGGNRILTTDVRVIAATNRDLTAAIAAGTFRSDLFYRLNVFPIEVPPLRKRKEDIPILVEYFVKRYAEKTGKQIRKIDKNTLELCQLYPWPGNIRELQNIVERSVILSTGDTFRIEEAWLASPEPAVQEVPGPLPDTLLNQEREIIETALAESKGKVAGPKGAAARLGIPRSTLDSKIKQLKIQKRKFVSEQ